MRTMLAADRTLMAWIRTSLGMLTFGYTLYKILEEVREAAKITLHPAAPRNAGVCLTVAGTVALLMGIFEYCGTLRMLRRSHKFGFLRPTLIVSGVMTAVGILLSAGIMARLL
jgi:putative membrane protein